MAMVKCCISTGVFDANAYVVSGYFDRWLLIDAPPPSALAAAGVYGDPDYLFLTHEHLDHIAGFREPGAFAGVKLGSMESAAERLADPIMNLSAYDPTGTPMIVRKPDIQVPASGLNLSWCDLEIKLHSAPGHSPASMVIQIDNNLFTGDTLILDHRTVTHLPGGNRNVLRQTLTWMFDNFAGDALVWPGHGPSFRLKQMSVKKAMGEA